MQFFGKYTFYIPIVFTVFTCFGKRFCVDRELQIRVVDGFYFIRRNWFVISLLLLKKGQSGFELVSIRFAVWIRIAFSRVLIAPRSRVRCLRASERVEVHGPAVPVHRIQLRPRLVLAPQG